MSLFVMIFAILDVSQQAQRPYADNHLH